MENYTIKKLIFKVFLITFLFAAIQGGALVKITQAFFQPEYQNRGLSNSLDGYVPPGFIYANYFSNFKSSKLRLGSKEAPGKFKLSVNTDIHQFAYVSKKEVFGGHLAGEVFITSVNGHVNNNGSRSNDSGLSDLLVTGFLQSEKKTLCLGNYQIPFHWRILGGIFFPTGKYDHDKSFNPGYHLYTFHFYFASSFYLTPKWDFGSRLMYNFHTTNTDYGPDKDNLMPGQLFNINFSSSYAVSENIHLGVTGYYWRQITDDTLNGHNLRGKELAFGIGPAFSLNKDIFSKRVFWFCDAFFDTTAKNRPKGTTLLSRIAVFF